MALDTARNRASALNHMCPWRGMFPSGDSTIDQGDRQMSAFAYAGVLAGAAVETVVGVAKDLVTNLSKPLVRNVNGSLRNP